MGKTLTALARASVGPMRTNIQHTFTVRNPRYTLNSVRATPANWRAPIMVAKVGSVSRYLAIHSTGGLRDKLAHRGQSVPTKLVRKTAMTKVTKSKWPSAYLRRANAYMDKHRARVASIKEKNKSRGGKGQRKALKIPGAKPVPFMLGKKKKILAIRKDGQIKALYRFPKAVHIKKVWRPEKSVQYAVKSNLKHQVRVQFNAALKNARMPGKC